MQTTGPLGTISARALCRSGAICLSLAAAALVGLALPASAEPAQFRVTEQVLNPQLAPFTATIDEIGNGHRLSPRGGGFEPSVFRTMFQATGQSATHVIAPADVLSNSDRWAAGALDGAEVEILRIERGAFRSVRTDRVAQGGHQSNGWRRALPRNRIVPGDQTSYNFAWRRSFRPDVPYYFTVRAVGRGGRLSAPAPAVIVQAPESLPTRKNRAKSSELIRADIDPEARWSAPPPQLRARLTDAGTVKLTWSPVRGATGYVIYRSDVPPEAHLGPYLALEGSGPPIKAGDLVILRQSFDVIDRRKLLTHRAWSAKVKGMRKGLLPWPDETDASWQLRRHAPDTPVQAPGQTYLEVTLDAGESLTMGHWNHAGTAQDWYPVLDPAQRYAYDVWMRADQPGTAVFKLTGVYEKRSNRVPPIKLTLTRDWQRFQGTFTVPALHEGKKVGQAQLRLTGPGIIGLDNFRIYRADTPFLAFGPEDVARLQASGMGALRTHGFIKTNEASYDLEELTNAGGAANTKGGNTLPQVLREIASVGMEPWLQIEPHFSRAEWLGLAEYLAAPFDPAQHDADARPWAAKRAAQGHAPWVARFDKVLFEIGNETWNRLFRPWVFEGMTDAVTGTRYAPGTVYGLYQEYVLGILRESPYWPALEGKLAPVIGGWARFSYGFDAAAVSPHSHYVTYADYNGGWDEQTGPAAPTPESFARILANAPLKSVARAERHHKQTGELRRPATAAPLRVGTYEAGPGYALNGLNKRKVSKEEAAAQELAMKSVAAGTATLDAFLARAAEGLVLQNFFTYGTGLRWTSHAPWHRGGQTYPSWDLLALFNRVGLGDMLAVEPRAVPMGRRSVRGGGEETIPLIAAYATQQGDRLTLIVLSRQVPELGGRAETPRPVEVEMPITGARSVTLYRQTGTLSSQNATEAQSRIVAENLPVPDVLPQFEIPDLPAGQARIYVFDGVTRK